jgi:hypothetical protein
MRWVLQTPRIRGQETTQPNQAKQTEISPGKRTSLHLAVSRLPTQLVPEFMRQTHKCRFYSLQKGWEASVSAFVLESARLEKSHLTTVTFAQHALATLQRRDSQLSFRLWLIEFPLCQQRDVN